jgi:hypothetical protein
MSESECRQFEKKLAHFTAPTLLGIKCASLVSLSREEFDIPSYAAAFNARAEKGGLQMQIMCRCQKRLLVLLYRPKLLQKRLEESAIRKFLHRYGSLSCAAAKAHCRKAGVSPRDRDIPGVSAGGCGRFYHTPGRKLQIVRLLEGVRQCGTGTPDICQL